MAQDISLVEVMARLVAAFALIIGLLGGALYVFRRRGMVRVPGVSATTRRLRVLERQSLSRSTCVALVRVGTSSYLIGATESTVSLLADVSETIDRADDIDARAAATTEEERSSHQRTGANAGDDPSLSARIDIVGAILQRMGRRA
jgi:flagellar biogenesis protein FliO